MMHFKAVSLVRGRETSGKERMKHIEEQHNQNKASERVTKNCAGTRKGRNSYPEEVREPRSLREQTMSRNKQKSLAETDANLAKGLQCPGNKQHNATQVVWRSSKNLPILTIGPNDETVNSCFIVWDVGSQDKIRFLRSRHYQRTNSLIFVVDNNDRERIEDAIEAVQEAESVATQNTEAGFHEADCPEGYGSAGHRRNHERVSDQRAAGSHDPEGSEELFIGEIVQIPHVTEHRVPFVFSARMIVEVTQQQFIDLAIQVAQLIDEMPQIQFIDKMVHVLEVPQIQVHLKRTERCDEMMECMQKVDPL